MNFSLSALLNNQTKWLERQQNSILSAASIITVASIVSALSGLIVKRALIAQFFGSTASAEALEAFWIAFQIPDLLFQLIGLGALSAAFIPIFTTYKKKDEQQAFRVSSIMMNVLLIIFLLASIIIFIFAKPLTIFRTGAAFTSAQVEIVVNLTRIMLLSQFFFAISNFMTGILQSFQRFIFPAIAPIFYNIGILIAVYTLSSTLGIYAAGVGVILGAFLHMLIQIPLVLKLGFSYKFSINIKDPAIKEFFKLMPPRVLSLGASEFRKLFLGFFTTSIGNLSYIVMQLGLTLMIIPIRFFGVPISQASLPFLSEEADNESQEKFTSLVVQSLHQIAFLSLPASILLLILRVPVVRLLFGTYNFPWTTTITTGKVVGILALSISLQAMAQLLTRTFYALKDTQTPFLVAIFDFILYLSLTAFFVNYTSWPLLGLAVATSTTAAVEMGLLLLLLSFKVKGIFSRKFWWPQLKIFSAGFLMAVFLYLPFKIFDELIFNTTRTIELISLTVTTSTIGILVYLYFAMLFEIKELQLFVKLASSFAPWKKTLSQSPEVLVEGSTNNPDSL